MRLIASVLALAAIAASPAFAQPTSPTQLPGRFQLELDREQNGLVNKFEGEEEEQNDEETTPSIQQNVPPNAIQPRVQITTSPRPVTPAPRATIKDGRDD